MPVYCYLCPDGHSFEQVLPMADCMKKQKCPECGRKAIRNIVAEHADGTVDSQMREYILEGENGCRPYAMSYLPQQMSEARKKHPGRDFREVNGCFIPVIKHRQDYKKYMKQFDPTYVEYS